MVRPTLRPALWLLALALGVLAQPAQAQAPSESIGVRTYTGYYNDTAVYFTAFETDDLNFATANNLIYAPRLARIWFCAGIGNSSTRGIRGMRAAPARSGRGGRKGFAGSSMYASTGSSSCIGSKKDGRGGSGRM